MTTTKRDFNTVAHFLLGLSAFATLMAIITSASHISLQKMMGFGTGTYVAEIICDVLILAVIALTFMKKRYGLIALIALFVIRMFATIPWNSDVSASYMLGGKFALFVRDFGFFAIAMCFKKNGISGWKSMLASDEYVEEHTIVPSAADAAPENPTPEEDVKEEASVPEEVPEEITPELEEPVSTAALKVSEPPVVVAEKPLKQDLLRKHQWRSLKPRSRIVS